MCIYDAPTALTYEQCVTDDKDPNVASTYTAHESYWYNDAIQDTNLNS